jgi:ubiquitin carboxyl-terminal hydrolase 1
LTAQKTGDGKITASKKKRIRELQRIIARLEDIIELADFEADISELGVKLDRSISPARKQVMFCAPPKLLVLHLSRSSFFEGSFGYSQKNNCRVKFPEYLDMDDFTTSSHLTMNPSRPLSSPMENGSSDDPRNGVAAAGEGDTSFPPALSSGDNSLTWSRPRFEYILCAIVVHIGSHSSGHYLTFRRRPRHPSKGFSRDWYRISDEDVEPANIGEVLSSNPFLLFYERLKKPSPSTV